MERKVADTRDQEHDEVWTLIPWLVNGRLSGDEAARVRAHIAQCPRCQNERDAQSGICEIMREDDATAFASAASFEKLMFRIDASEQLLSGTGPSGAQGPAGRRSEGQANGGPGIVRWLVAAVVLEALGLALLGTWMWTYDQRAMSELRRAAGAYVTLSEPGEPGSEASLHAPTTGVKVVFAPNVPIEELNTLLRSIDARIVDGPSAAGVYALTFAHEPESSEQLEDRVAELRASVHVRFAEPATLYGIEPR